MMRSTLRIRSDCVGVVGLSDSDFEDVGSSPVLCSLSMQNALSRLSNAPLLSKKTQYLHSYTILKAAGEPSKRVVQ